MLAGSRTLHLSAIGFATVEATLFQAAFPDYDVFPLHSSKIEDEDEFEDEYD